VSLLRASELGDDYAPVGHLPADVLAELDDALRLHLAL
jgi:mRNA-degrading endonuclease toxin of MazEF toxin-antitoxin module